MSEAIIAKKAEQVAIVAEKMKAAASIVVVDSRFYFWARHKKIAPKPRHESTIRYKK